MSIPFELRARNVLRVGGRATPIGGREARLARLLKSHPEGLTRVDMLRMDETALALGAPGYVSRLRKAGAPIVSVPTAGTDAAGGAMRFARYRLGGEVHIAREPWPPGAQGAAE